jgi:hypothetical protein
MSGANQGSTRAQEHVTARTNPTMDSPGSELGPADSVGHRRRPLQRDPRRNNRAAVATPSPGRAPERRGECRAQCAFSEAMVHHDRLLAIDADPDELLELLELAVTWAELDYSDTPVIPPEHWMNFLRSHDWPDPNRVERIFSLAADIAMATRAQQQPPSSSMIASFTESTPREFHSV